MPNTKEMFKGDNLNEWAKHFRISDQTLELLSEWGVDAVSDLADVVSEESFMKELKEKVSKIDYIRIVRSIELVEVLSGVRDVDGSASPSSSTKVSTALATAVPSAPLITSSKVTAWRDEKSDTMPPTPPTLSMDRKGKKLEEADRRLEELRAKMHAAETQRLIEERQAEIRRLEMRIDEKTEEDERTKKLLEKTAKKKKMLQKLEKQLKDAGTVDVAIVLDCTSSMGPYIKKCAEEIICLVDSIGEVYPDLTLRVAFVGYRDHCDGDQRLCVLRNGCSSRFTTDIEEFRSFVRNVRAQGGGDAPEDVMGGLNIAAELEWASSCRILYHIADAPCHGSKYHNLSDGHPSGDPNGLTPDGVLQKLYEHQIMYYFGKLNTCTDKMIQEFNKVAPSPNFIQAAAMNQATIINVMSGSISASLASSFSTSSYTDSAVVKMADVKLVSGMPCWSEVKVDSAMRYPMQAVTSVEELLSPTFRCIQVMPERDEIRLKLAPHPFAKGAMKAAYYTKSISSPSDDVVLKASMATSARHQTCEKYEQFLTCHVAAHYFSEEFNRRKPAGCPSICYVRASIMQIQSRPSRPFYIEEETIKGEFEKYNNNHGMCREQPTSIGTDHRAVQAFSHWTYEHSSHRMMVVDCQGFYDRGSQTFVLTDPAVHCETLVAFGNTNLQKLGFERFLKSHRCNEYCQALHLPKCS